MCSSVDGPLSWFHVLVIVNTAAMNTGVHVSFQIMVFSRYMHKSRIAGSYGSSIFSFLRNPRHRKQTYGYQKEKGGGGVIN